MKIVIAKKPKCIDYNVWESPVGNILVAASDGTVIRIILPAENKENPVNILKKEFYGIPCTANTLKLKSIMKELDEYFQKRRKIFTTKLTFLTGTPFQQSVWKALSHVPYGEIRTYGDIAVKVGRPKAFRAVGGANHANPIPILIPCHRVIGANGSLVGFGGGLEMKAKLLQLEKHPNRII